MRLQIKYDINIACKVILQEQLEKIGIPFTVSGMGELEIDDKVSPISLIELANAIQKYGIKIIDNPKNAFVQRVKDTIIEIVHQENAQQTLKVSVYLAEKLNFSYGYISTVFSEVTHTSIENFIIIHKIERAKVLLVEKNLTLTEIAWLLNYSSVAHLSNQFKKTTGLTPTAFLRIIKKRSE
ncbi:MAG: helix-turn-helix transcriptional regulator [Flavobacterium sp.]|nr:helix-turn-helix transcriptional regulator [Flavobacterium sp.]